ncbi:hypothetical protein BJ165DRAFT_1518938 [Panaeolus papilionaceus]|nr:hypothetical protein BJ165DRAFT_1518938 [Panaeolus papilionaceus]
MENPPPSSQQHTKVALGTWLRDGHTTAKRLGEGGRFVGVFISVGFSWNKLSRLTSPSAPTFIFPPPFQFYSCTRAPFSPSLDVGLGVASRPNSLHYIYIELCPILQ